jgi:transposase
MKDESLENSILYLHGQGWSIRKLSREFCISRGRVKRIIENNSRQREGNQKEPGRRPKTSKLNPYKEFIGEILEKYKDPPPTNQRIYELIGEKGYQGGITTVRNYLYKIRGKSKKEPVYCIETFPGQRANHDWSEYDIFFSGDNKKEKIIFFSIILSYSRRQYIEIVSDKTQHTLFECFVNSFHYFEGVPRQIKGDDQKACVDRWEQGQPVFNKHFLEFASHYRFRPLAIHPGKPKENLKVERPFYYLETNFLNARSFVDKDDLKQQLQSWLTSVNDTRIHRTTGKRPIDLFAEELAHLTPLPLKHYDTSIIEYRIVNNESCVQWQTYFYWVPSKYMYENCPVRIKDNHITIYTPDFKEIKRYALAPKGSIQRYIGRDAPSSDKPDYMPAQQVIEKLKTFGPLMEQYIKEVMQHKKSNYRYHLQHILSMKVYYLIDDILKAVKRAMNYKVYESKAIENFLSNHAQKKNELTI